MPSHRGPKAFHSFAHRLKKTFGWIPTPFHPAPEGGEYGAGTFTLGEKTALFRLGKETPKKPGAFVALWRRDHSGSAIPFSQSDPIDLLIIQIEGERSGTFIFPKQSLIDQGLIASPGKRGKNGVRVYPPWLTGLNPTATKAQQWQNPYFVEWRGEPS